MRSISLDESQLANLTPEEQAAITGDEFTEGEVKALKGIAGADTDDTDDDADDTDEVLDADGNPVATETVVPPAAKSEPAPQAKAEPEPAPAPAPTKAPVYEAKLPDDFNDQISTLATQETELRDKFKAGEIDLDEYDSKREAILQQRETLNRQQIKAEISGEMTQQAAAQQWQNQIADLMQRAAKPEGGGIDYNTDTEKAGDLDTFVKTLASNPAHADKDGPWFLNEAHKRVLALHGLTPAPAAGDKPGKQQASRTPPIDAAPKTLAQVPGGDGPGDVAGEFAHLDALEGDALESAIAKMSPAQREKYSRGE